MGVRRGTLRAGMERGTEAVEGILREGCGREAMPVPGGTRHRLTALAQGHVPLTAVAAGGRRRLAAMPNDTASQPRATVGEPAGLASCAQGPAHNHESHAGAGEYKVRKASTVRFLL